MADDGNSFRGLPKWPREAGEVSEGLPDPNPREDGPNGDVWLVVVGVLYPLVGFGVLIWGGGPMGPLAFSPLIVPLPAFVLIFSVIGMRLQGVRLEWASVALFVGWVLLVAYMQLQIYAEASAAV